MNELLTTDEWNRIEDVFAKVADEAPEKQSKLLKRLTANAPRIRKEVQSLLAHDSPSAPVPSIPPASLATAPRRIPGTVINSWRLIVPLMTNRVSDVWCAEHVDSQTRAAVKFLQDQGANRLARFENEARYLARFRHPNIALFLDAGRDDDGVPYIVTKFVDGQPIDDFADQRQQTVTERLELMLPVCDAVAYSHRFLVVHRDLKPSNILVAAADSQPVLLDFGISKELIDADSSSVGLTQTDDRPMTPAFASPEQVRGEPITTATDVYAVGLVLYELLTGHHAYSAAAHPGVEHLFDRICQSVPKAPSEVIAFSSLPLEENDGSTKAIEPRLIAALRGCSPKQLRRQLRRIDGVILKAMSRAADDRYQSIADLRHDLVRLIEGRPVSIRREKEWLGTTVRRAPVRSMVATACLTLLVAVAVGGWLWKQNSSRVQEDVRQSQELATAANARSEQAQRTVEEARSEFRDLQKTLVEMSSGGQLSPPGSISPAARVILVNEAFKRGAFANARDLLAAAPPFDADGRISPDTRLEFANAWQLLGRPTKAMEFLEATIPPEYFEAPDADGLARRSGKPSRLHRIRRDDSLIEELSQRLEHPGAFQAAMIRLLIDCGRKREANKWSELEFVPVEERDVALQLAIIQARREIGWPEGATDLLNEVLARPDLASAHREHAEFLEAVISEAATVEPKLSSFGQKPERSLPHLLLLCRAQMYLAAVDEGALRTDEAIARLQQVIEQLQAADLPHHHLVRSATTEMSRLHAVKGNADASTQAIQTAWQSACAANEFGTELTARIANEFLANTEDADSVYAALDQLASFAVAAESSPYIDRHLLYREFDAVVEKQDWPRADLVTTRLVGYEAKLWGDDSIENAHALAMAAFVHRQLNRPQQATDVQQESRRIVGLLVNTVEDNPVVGFLRATMNDTEEYRPDYEWIQLYLMQRYNPANVQQDVVNHELRQLPESSPDRAALIAE